MDPVTRVNRMQKLRSSAASYGAFFYSGEIPLSQNIASTPFYQLFSGYHNPVFNLTFTRLPSILHRFSARGLAPPSHYRPLFFLQFPRFSVFFNFECTDRGCPKDDLLSGITVALALVPEAVAFAFVAGVEPLVGLYAAFMVGLITAVFGGRPGMISGATGALAVVMVSLVA